MSISAIATGDEISESEIPLLNDDDDVVVPDSVDFKAAPPSERNPAAGNPLLSS
ncbi:UNVERIFIED_CONTAM: hypothetical protein Slati_2273000 [Sesamum latifolium]|uniref:Uncharacterized protein n=1 Tax=Sesamum latifolium TaxID=2727402 RepID=A0AAW2W9F8_9LAMI